MFIHGLMMNLITPSLNINNIFMFIQGLMMVLNWHKGYKVHHWTYFVTTDPHMNVRSERKLAQIPRYLNLVTLSLTIKVCSLWYLGLNYERQKYYAAQVLPSQGSNPWPPDHDYILCYWNAVILTTRPTGKLILTAHFMCGLMSDLVICKLSKYGHTWHRMSLLTYHR